MAVWGKDLFVSWQLEVAAKPQIGLEAIFSLGDQTHDVIIVGGL